MIRFTSELFLPILRFRDGTYDSVANYIDVEVEEDHYVYLIPDEYLGLFELCTEDKSACIRPTYIQAFPF